jgi:hypothetical protein
MNEPYRLNLHIHPQPLFFHNLVNVVPIRARIAHVLLGMTIVDERNKEQGDDFVSETLARGIVRLWTLIYPWAVKGREHGTKDKVD